MAREGEDWVGPASNTLPATNIDDIPLFRCGTAPCRTLLALYRVFVTFTA